MHVKTPPELHATCSGVGLNVRIIIKTTTTTTTTHKKELSITRSLRPKVRSSKTPKIAAYIYNSSAALASAALKYIFSAYA